MLWHESFGHRTRQLPGLVTVRQQSAETRAIPIDRDGAEWFVKPCPPGDMRGHSAARGAWLGATGAPSLGGRTNAPLGVIMRLLHHVLSVSILTAAFGVPAVAEVAPRQFAALAATGTGATAAPAPTTAEIAFRQAVAEGAAGDAAMAAFYRERDYAPIWTGAGDADRRGAFLSVFAHAGEHGLPATADDPATLIAAFEAVHGERDRGLLEARMSRVYLAYARDVQTGILTPSKVDPTIVRSVPLRDHGKLLAGIAGARPMAYLRSLPPSNPAYTVLMKEKLRLERVGLAGGWGPKVGARAVKVGSSGAPVIALRDRLVAMGYLARTAAPKYDADLQAAVQRFQADHGMVTDGAAGEATIREVNVEPVERLQSVLVAMERLRWINMDLGPRHVWVNLADFTAKLVDDGKVSFETRAVIGKPGSDTRTPEFSDQMEFLVVNPTWNVPRSITVKEYLPLLQQNPFAAGHLRIIDRYGRTVPRDAVDWRQFTPATFPFVMKQPPSDGNALGLVKFMFPNRWNIYLHDTPTKSLFKREVRAFSHGCIRLGDPFDFAYALLARQSADPESTFKAALRTRVETVLPLKVPVPVHLVYFTAWPDARGRITYRRDIYGRDARIFDALAGAGVTLRSTES